jgi:two-component system, LuxR family, sensor kinase FixL
MSRLDRYLAFAESHRLVITAVSALMIAVIAWLDWFVPDSSMGFLYLVPILVSAAALSNGEILVVALVCGYLRETLDPLQGVDRVTGPRLLAALNPANWVSGSYGRLVVAVTGFAMTGFFVVGLNRRRRTLQRHLVERDTQIRLRQEAEERLLVLIDTSPLAILTLDAQGSVILSNESARQLLGFEEGQTLAGVAVEPYLPILKRMLRSDRAGGFMRTGVECKGQRRGGEVFQAHVWLSTYAGSNGPGLAAVIWDASENLRDREDAGFDSMMATTRVVIGAMAHEIRNLASAAATAHAALAADGGSTASNQHYQVLGTLLQGLERIASSGLRAPTARGRAVSDLGTVLDETRIVIEPPLREDGISVTWSVEPGLPLVEADHQGLLQVFVNLARNSRQALQSSPRRELRISAAQENDLVVVRFRDTGPGVAHPEELFRPFQPGADSLGLGLYISRAILRAHGGGLRHEPQSEGCSFAVDLWPAENRAEEI